MSQAILTNPQELETWLDEFMAEEMSKLHLPGVTFSLVQNGSVFLAKGYGYADLEQKISVDADRTLFRVGSISKLFTATAIMQLVEKDLLNLDEDVNQYLQNFAIANNYPQPVTIANLLTHTAGFDDSAIGICALEADDMQPLGIRLAAKMPPRVLPPGEVISYSNYGYALLGYIVELVAGIPFSQYIEENILQPLEMNHSSFQQPSSLAKEVALGYRYDQKKSTYQVFPFQYVAIPPAGSLSATATDMAKFAIAHLQSGKYKSAKILSESTANQMQQQQFTHDPRLPGIGWGFMESSYHQQRGVWHNGGLPGFLSFFYLLPSHNLGIFVSNNGGADLSAQLMEKFFTRYFPVEQNPLPDLPSAEKQQRLRSYQGSYRNNRYSRKTLAKASLLFSSSLQLKLENDGNLSVPQTLKSPKPIYLQEVEPFVLQIKDDPDQPIIVQENDQRKITTLQAAHGVFEKLSWYETNTFHWTLICWFILVFLSGLVVSILALIKFPGNSIHQLAQLLGGVTCGLNLMFILGMLTVQLLSKNNDQLKLVYGIPKIVFLLLCIPLITLPSAFGLTLVASLTWINHDWSYLEQLHYSLVSLTSIGWIFWLNYWNLFGFKY